MILVQHKNGFVTAYSHTGTPMAVAGDGVEAGQVLALAPSPDADGSRWFLIRMWHNGLPVVPYEYLAEKTFESAQTIQKYEAPRGKE